MGANSKIEWCDHTWNPWIGCTEVSPACDHCYARTLMAERYGRVRWGAGEDRVRTSKANWREPFKWDRAAAENGRPAFVFCLSLGDIWDNEVDALWRRDAFAVMGATPNLIYLLLSKRIGNAERMCDPLAGNPSLPPNAALGATMVNQEEWDRDIGKLEHAGEVLGARFTFASVEPMIGPIDARGDLPDWVICGGESGPRARPMHPDWARSLRDQCAAAGVPFFMKQWGEWAPGEAFGLIEDGPVTSSKGSVRNWMKRYVVCADRADRLDGHSFTKHATNLVYRVGKHRAGRLLDGREHNAFPASLREAPLPPRDSFA